MTEPYKDFKDRILQAVPIENYIGRYVSLTRHGKYFKGLCPFHSEKTPSFTVTPEKGLYHCFGCGKGGDIFSFVMEMDGVSFADAVDILARYAGIEKPGKQKQSNTHHDRLASVNKLAQDRFTQFLWSEKGKLYLDYLLSRGLSRITIETFALGASPDDWRWLTPALESSEKDAMELGLIKESKGSRYDFYRGRVIFPIQDLTGRTVGFGGRILPGKDLQIAKYINSPESPLFHKGSLLYGLKQAISVVRREQSLVLVEGYLDVLGLSQSGITNVAAPLGTALTKEHLSLIQRYASEIILLLDGDRAGRAAALKFAQLVVDHGFSRASVVLLPEGMDPFDLSRQCSSMEIQDILHEKISSDRYLIYETIFPDRFISFSAERIRHIQNQKEEAPGKHIATQFSRLAREFYLGEQTDDTIPDISLRREGLDRLIQLVKQLPDRTNQELFMDEGAKILGLSPASLRLEVEKMPTIQKATIPRATLPREAPVRPAPADVMVPTSVSTPSHSGGDSVIIDIERRLVLEFLHSPGLYARNRESMYDFEFQDEHSEYLLRVMEDRFMRSGGFNTDELYSYELPPETIQLFTRMIMETASYMQQDEEENRLEGEYRVKELLTSRQIALLKKKRRELDDRMKYSGELEKEALLQESLHIISDIKSLEEKRRTGRL